MTEETEDSRSGNVKIEIDASVKGGFKDVSLGIVSRKDLKEGGHNDS